MTFHEFFDLWYYYFTNILLILLILVSGFMGFMMHLTYSDYMFKV